MSHNNKSKNFVNLKNWIENDKDLKTVIEPESKIHKKNSGSKDLNLEPMEKIEQLREDPHNIVDRITKLIENNYHLFGGWGHAFDDILELIFCTLTRYQEGQEERYMEIVKKIGKKALNVSTQIFQELYKALYYDMNIFDYLGQVYMQLGMASKQKYFGQYFTSWNVAFLIAKIVIGDVNEKIEKVKKTGKKETIHDPACGSGVMFLAPKKLIIDKAGIKGLDYFEFSGQDIDRVCVMMCKIQLLLTDYRYMYYLQIATAGDLRREAELKKKSLDVLHRTIPRS